MVGWVAVGLGTMVLGCLALYWQDVRNWFKDRRRVVRVSDQEVTPKLDISVEQIVAGALFWVGCMRYTYLCPDGVQGVIWAPSDESAMVYLRRCGCDDALLRTSDWEQPKAGDLVVYDEEVYPCTQ